MSLIQLTGEEFVAQLGSSAPVPGGGGASAFVGAVGTALGSMVASLTVGKKKYAAVEEEVRELKLRTEKLQNRLLALVDGDAEGFAPLHRAYGLPAQTTQEQAEKARVMEQALRTAIQVPMEIMELCVQALDAIERLGQIGSRLAVSDAGCAAACCRAALQSASLNVFINTKAMKDRAYANEINGQAEKFIRYGVEKADQIFTAVLAQLN